MKITSSFRLIKRNVSGIGVLLLCTMILQAGCTEQDEDSQQGHAWQQQTDALDKAQAVEDILQDSADEQRRQIEQQTQ